MKKRRQEIPEERRKPRVELNLLGEGEATRAGLPKPPRGCSLPFFGSLIILLVPGCLLLLRPLLG